MSDKSSEQIQVTIDDTDKAQLKDAESSSLVELASEMRRSSVSVTSDGGRKVSKNLFTMPHTVPLNSLTSGVLGSTSTPASGSPVVFKSNTQFSGLRDLLKQNRLWAKAMKDKDPEFFDRLRAQQNPQLLWIGCADSRVPANQIVSLAPGEVFVHRNIANVVHHVDINCMSVIQYAVEVLKVKHIIVVGHYGCGGVLASMRQQSLGGVIDVWIRALKDIYENHREILEALPDDNARADLLCELNVASSVLNVCKSTVVQNAWSNGQPLAIHGWCYRLTDGILRDLDICIQSADQIDKVYHVSEKKQSEK